MDEHYTWVHYGGRHVGKNWITKTLNESPWTVAIDGTITMRNNMRITLDVPLVGINKDGENVRSDSAVRFVSEDCEVVTLKMPDGKKFRLDHDMLKRAIETIGRVNC